MLPPQAAFLYLMSTQLGSNSCDRAEQEARQGLIDDLYRRDGRECPSHPHHATYTGLWQHYTSTQNPTAQ